MSPSYLYLCEHVSVRQNWEQIATSHGGISFVIHRQALSPRCFKVVKAAVHGACLQLTEERTHGGARLLLPPRKPGKPVVARAAGERSGLDSTRNGGRYIWIFSE